MPEKMSGFPEQYLVPNCIQNQQRLGLCLLPLITQALQPQGSAGWKGSLDCPLCNTGPAPGQMWLLVALSCVVLKAPEDGDCTVWALWGPQLTCLRIVLAL